MAKKSASLRKGDWIVHTYYGVGQIKGVETKQIDDTKTKYYKVETKNSIYFVPVSNIDNERIRPVASQYMLRKAKKILKETPQDFDTDHNLRKRQLTELLSDCSIETTTKIVRDLSGRRANFGLNDHEEKILEKLTDRLVLEWSITKGIELEKANQQFEEALREGLSKYQKQL